MLDFKVKAVGDQVKFSGVDTNQIEMTLVGGATGTGNCRLDRVTGGTQTLATSGGAVGPGLVTFMFDVNNLTVDNGAEVELQVICDTASMLAADPGGTQISASIESATTSIEWSDNVQADIVGAGTYIFQTAMPGYTAKVTT